MPDDPCYDPGSPPDPPTHRTPTTAQVEALARLCIRHAWDESVWAAERGLEDVQEQAKQALDEWLDARFGSAGDAHAAPDLSYLLDECNVWLSENPYMDWPADVRRA